MSVFISTFSSYDSAPEELQTPEDDWDTLTAHPVFSAGSLLIAHQVYDKGQAHPVYSAMRVVDRTFKELACGTNRYSGTVVYKGIADLARPAKYQIQCYGERSTYDAVLSPVSFLVPAPTDISQPRMGVTVRYISTSRPNTDAIGSNLVPPSPSGGWDVPENVFSSSPDVILAYPEGWVLEKRGGPNIPGTEIWLVEDEYVYYFEWRPRG